MLPEDLEAGGRSGKEGSWSEEKKEAGQENKVSDTEKKEAMQEQGIRTGDPKKEETEKKSTLNKE